MNNLFFGILGIDLENSPIDKVWHVPHLRPLANSDALPILSTDNKVSDGDAAFLRQLDNTSLTCRSNSP